MAVHARGQTVRADGQEGRVASVLERIRSRSRGALVSPRLPAVAVVLGCLLSLPVMRTPLVMDDLWHRAILLHDRRWLPVRAGPLLLFNWGEGSVEESARRL